MLSKSPNQRWTIEEADMALRAEAELIKRTAKPMKGWPLNEIEREYQFFQNDREWPES